MAATELGELVVRLSMEHGDTTSQIGRLKTEMKSLDSGFKATAAAAGGFSSKLDEARAASTNLTQKLEVQKSITEQMAQQLQNANAKLNEAKQRYSDYGQKIEEARGKSDGLKAEIAAITAQMEASKAATGDNTEEYISLSVELDRLNTELSASDAALKKVSAAHQKADQDIAKATRGVQNATIAYNNAKAVQGEIQAALDKTSAQLKNNAAAWEDASKKLTDYGKRASEVGDAQEKLGKKLTTTVTAPIIAAGTGALVGAIGWESDFAGVEKTVSGTAEQMAALNAELLEMSTNIPTTSSGLAEIAANAGQLGIAYDDVLGFTRVIADLNETTNLTTEQGAQDFAKFANITGMDKAQDSFSRLGSTVVELGNSLATTEKDIVSMAMNIGAAGKQAGMSQAEIMGISAALSSLGLEAAGGGTAISKTILDMQVAVETGSDRLKEYATVANMTAKEFAQAFKTDAAGALSAFIEGLASGNESAVKMLTDMDIKETRLRDALLRASSAGDLFSNSIKMASGAWKDNTALTKEAEVRYQTTASRLSMMGNQAKVAAITFGNDLLPMLESGMDVVSGLIERFGSLDEATRGQIIQWAGIAAAVGPAVMIIGKANSAIGAAATGIGKFAASVATAGGGLGGFVSAVGGLLGPAGIGVLAVAAIAGGIAWIDYASGAKAAREALEGMNETAKQWNSTQANTVYDTGNNALGRFGLSESDFGGADADTRSWFDRMKTTWTDGKKETNDIVKSYVDEFKGSSDQLREAIEQRKEVLAGLGVEDSASDGYLKQLDAYDKEVASLLKKRQNGMLTEDDETRLNEIVQARMQIQIEYVTGEGGGFDQILQGVEAEKARIEAEGGKIEVDLYGDAMAAAAKGNATLNQSLNETYAAQHKVISAMQEGADKEAALAALNEQHQQAKQDAARKYAETLSELVGPALKSEDVGGAEEQLQSLIGLLSEYQIVSSEGGNTSSILQSMDELTKGMDEGELASYLAIITQIQDAISQGGLTDAEAAELFPELDISTILGGYQSLGEFLAANAGDYAGLNEMFNQALPDEVRRVMIELGLEGAEQQWAGFIEGKSTLSVNTEITGLPDEPLVINASVPVELSNVPDTITVNADAPVTITGLPDGPITIPANTPTTLTGVPENITVQCDAPVELTGMPDAITVNADAPVELSNIPDTITVNADAPVTITGLPDGPITIPANTPTTLTGVPENITVQCDAPVTLTGVPPSVFVPGMVRLTPIDTAAVTAFRAANPIGLDGQVQKVGMVANAPQTFKTAFDAGLLALYGADGLPIPVTPTAMGQITSTDLILGTDENGVLHVQVVPQLGSAEGVQAAQEEYGAKPESPMPDWMTDGTAEQKVAVINAVADSIANLKEQGDEMAVHNAIEAPVGGIKALLDDLNPEDLERIGGLVANLMASLNSGEMDEGQTEAAKAQIDAILAMVEQADAYLGIGNDVSAGIAQGMNAYGWDGDASSLASSLEAAIRSGLQTHSPSALTMPIGTDVAAGVGKGMSTYSFAADAAAMAGSLKSAIASAATDFDSEGSKIGKNFVSSIASAVSAGKSSAINAAAEVARAMLAAAKSALGIASPSKEGLGIGSNFVRSIAQGGDGEAGYLDKTTRKALSPLTTGILDELDGAIRQRVPNVLGQLQAMEMQAASQMQARYLSAIMGPQVQPEAGPAMQIDYEKLAEANAQRPIAFAVGKDQLATSMATHNTRAVGERTREVAFGYGGGR